MQVLMPQLGETVSEGKVIRWFKSPGENVLAGENLCEIETDKVTVEVPAISGGVLGAIFAETGDVAAAGAVIAVIIRTDESPSISSNIRQNSVQDRDFAPVRSNASAIALASKTTLDPFREVRTPASNFGPARIGGGIMVTPLARRLAREAELDLTQIVGSGARGRIVGRDIEAARVLRASASPAVADEFEDMIPAVYGQRPHRVVTFNGLRQAKAPIRTKSVTPCFFLTTHIAAGRLARIRAEMNESAPKDSGGAWVWQLSLRDFMIRALALALQEVPAANVIWTAEGLFVFEQSDVAVAMSVASGLAMPVILAADSKTVSGISREAKTLIALAGEGRLELCEHQGGATTFCDVSMYGVSEFSPILQPPQATMLTIGAVERHPTETPDGGFIFSDRVTVTLACDPRVLNVAQGAEVLCAFRSLIENPLRLLV